MKEILVKLSPLWRYFFLKTFVVFFFVQQAILILLAIHAFGEKHDEFKNSMPDYVYNLTEFMVTSAPYTFLGLMVILLLFTMTFKPRHVKDAWVIFIDIFREKKK